MRARKVRFVRPEEDPEALADSAEPDFAGAWPNFGKATQFVPGRAFEVEGNATDEVAVGKQFSKTAAGC